MQRTTFAMARLLAGLAVTIFIVSAAWGGTETRLYNFGGTQGKTPNGGLIFDASGNLYGTTQSGGLNQAGVVFQLHKTSKGVWIENILYNFVGPTDGSAPRAGLVFDSAGNLYGTTSAGGLGGFGTVFELSPNGLGGFNETTLYSFLGGSDGSVSFAKLVFDGAGNLYGTTSQGGASNMGTVFELTPSGSGWTESVLHSFAGTDGATPLGELILDGAGNLYGTTYVGGSKNQGVAFELVQADAWAETVLHDFKGGADGLHPQCGLLSVGGVLYGTTNSGGGAYLGTVFALVNHITSYTETEYIFFRGQGGDEPVGTLAYNSATDTFFGATALGTFQAGNSAGTIFTLQPGGSVSDYYSFNGGINENQTHDGEVPQGGLILDGAGNVYGSTQKGGTGAGGTVFEVTP
jgi:uncharacterized repeat protein (TIGR03803 family)